MVDGFLRKMQDALSEATGQQYDQDADYDRQVRPASEDPYGDPAYQDFGDVRPASEDPYGDPASYGSFGDVRPASEDPYGDPASYGPFGDVRPASEDPYGDPADQYYNNDR